MPDRWKFVHGFVDLQLDGLADETIVLAYVGGSSCMNRSRTPVSDTHNITKVLIQCQNRHFDAMVEGDFVVDNGQVLRVFGPFWRDGEWYLSAMLAGRTPLDERADDTKPPVGKPDDIVRKPQDNA